MMDLLPILKYIENKLFNAKPVYYQFITRGLTLAHCCLVCDIR